MSKKYKPRINGEILKQIVVYKSDNPEKTLSEIAEKFKVGYSSVRYAITKYTKDIGLIKLAGKRDKQKAAKILSSHLSEEDILKCQLEKIVGELNLTDDLALPTRIELLGKVLTLIKRLQTIELSNHLKRADADIIIAIIRRFKPEAAKEEIIKIYQEETEKLKNAENE